ncbi:MAG: mandelate racemase [Anaerolineaceae bacterium]|nr:mandelate racemase [Anaerolineaceae bacterium]
MHNPRLTTIEAGYLAGKRPRTAGSNARLPEHGINIREPFVRLRFEDGSSGFGFSRLTKEQANALLGQPLDSLISLETGVSARSRSINFPLWDALGQRMNQPVYQLVGKQIDANQPFTVPCYDTSLYFDDLHLTDDKAAVELIVSEAQAGYERGHRAFKIKVGRGALHMPLVEGTFRDIAIIRGVREAVGAGLPIMIDANNGYNVNLVKWVLTETADCEIYWLEEAFHEDRVLYEGLHQWLDEQQLPVLIADGEGQASPTLMNWTQAGVIDVVQYDLRDEGFDFWIKTGQQLDTWGAKSAPHNYGSCFGNYATCHLASAIEQFTFVEWDQIDLVGLDSSGYAIQDGRVHVPNRAGFGLRLDESVFEGSVKSEGFVVS